MFEFTRLMKFDVKVVVAEDILHESDTAKALVSRELADKLRVKNGDTIRLTRENISVCFEAEVSEFSDGVDIVIPSGYFAAKLADLENPKLFGAEVEKCDKADSI